MFAQDLRFSFRMLRKNPWLNAVIIAIFALGVGLTAAIFSIVNSVLLRPLSYTEPQQLFVIREVIAQWTKSYDSLPVNLPDAQIWQKQCSSFDGIAIAEPTSMNITEAGEAQKLKGIRASANLFQVLGVRLAAGRSFSRQSDQAGHGYEVVLTHKFWKKRFQSDRSVLGKTITLDEDAYTVVGILPPSFHFPVFLGPMTSFPADIDFFQPLNGPREYERALFGDFDFAGIARLKRGIPKETALAELNVVQAGIAKLANQNLDLAAKLIPMEQAVTADGRRQLYYLLFSAVALLMIGCTNIINLLLARGPARMRETAIRLALCGNRMQVFRQLLIENVVPGLIGGVVGIVLAYNFLDSLLAIAPPGIPRLDEVRMDWRVICFSGLLSLSTATIAGILPAWRMSRTDPYDMLKSGAITTTQNLQTRRLRQALIAFEVSLCTLLLLLAGLLTSSLIRLLDVHTGFRTDRVLAADVELPPRSYSQPEARLAFYDRAAEQARSLPGVASAAWISILPFEGEGSVTDIGLPGHDAADNPKANYRVVSPEYFRTMGIPILSGREFVKTDRTRHVVIVSKSLADYFWPGQDPIGKMCVSYWGGKQTNEVIGVAGDIRIVTLDQPPLLMVYTPVMFAQALPNAPQDGSIVLRTESDPFAAAPDMRRVISGIDKDVPVVSLQPMSVLVSRTLSGRRFQLILSLVLGFTALILAVLGVFGMVAYSTEQRHREIGIRVAIGATPAELRNMILWQGMKPVFIGLMGGIIVGFFAAALITAFLYGVSNFDLTTIACVVSVISLFSAIACWIPARRALRVDANVALRCE